MLLKQLELQGFKTFAARTEFTFNSGLTAIVGPNGSGKSNIADAIRWVLGEQRPSNLRIKRTDDLIFAGSRERARQGMAEVVMTLDNSTGWLPIDFAEVTILRRVYRSGESEYRINDTRVRTRDVSDLLGQGGLTRDSYVVIGQGLVDAALSLRPAERRSLFEAAAGIDIYLAKKEEANRRLEETRQNLVRVNDLAAEVAPRLARLGKQAERAEEHALFTRDLHELLRLWYGYHWQQASLHHDQSLARIAEMTELLSHHQARIDDLRREGERIAAVRAQLRQQLSAWHQESGGLHARAEETGRKLAVAQERYRLLTEHREELTAEIASLFPRRAEHEAQIADTEDQLQAAAAELAATESELRGAQARWKEQEQARAKLVSEQRSNQSQLNALMTRIAQHGSRLDDLAARRDEITRDLAQSASLIDGSQRELEQLRKGLRDGLERESAEREQIQTIQAGIQEARHRLESLQSDQDALNREDASLQNELEALRSRQRMLAKMRDELSGYYAGVRQVMQAVDRGQLERVPGPVVRLLDMNPNLDVAISVALGAHLQDVVVETWRDAEAAIDLLKSTRGGRATFLPLDTVRSRPNLRSPRGRGIVGLASDLIAYEPRYKGVFDMLLNRTLVVQDLETARRLLPELRSGMRAVTLEGELVLANGSVSGGSLREADSKIGLERDWRELPGLLDKVILRRDQLSQRIRESAKAIEMANAEIAGTESLLGQSQGRLEQATRQRREIESQQSRIQAELALHERSRLRHEADQTTLQQRESQLLRDRQASEQEAAAAAILLDKVEKRLAAVDTSELRQEAADIETRLAVARRNSQGLLQFRDQQRFALRRLHDEIAAKRHRADEIGDDLASLATTIQTLKAQADDQSSRLANLKERIDPAESEVLALQREETTNQELVEGARTRHHETETLLQEASLNRKLYDDEMERLQQRMAEDIGPVVMPRERSHQLRFDLGKEEAALPVTHDLPPTLDGEIRDLRARLRRLGVVNPDAPSEYQAEMERHTFMQEQVQDLEQAIKSLNDVIQEMDEIMEVRFSQTFSAIAKAFGRYFQLLFGGGTARLTLTDPDNFTETGVDIVARPPGKRLQSLALLSGGERALTAASLLFAILDTRPLPFCVLDEVDAMLDEANVGRFRDILVEMSQRTQFIVVTHNRHTVDAANAIYGITMRRDGSSAALSLKLDEAEKQLVPEADETSP